MKLDVRSFFPLMIVVVLLSLPFAGASFGVSAQQNQQSQAKCPKTTVSFPDSVHVSDKMRFSAEVRGGDAKVVPTYNWTVSAGSIQSGQGTPTIEVSTNELTEGSYVTATVEVGGFDRACGYGSSAASSTGDVLKKIEARKVDDYGKLASKEEEDRLANFLSELQQNPTAQGYIIAYSGQTSRAGDSQKAADKVVDYLVNKRRLERSRLVTVTGGVREQPTVELWLVPTGAQPPKPTPVFKPSESKATGPVKSAKP
jgi:anti-sigma-K factor RskA